MKLRDKSKKYRKEFEKNNRANFNKILEEIITNNGEIGEIEAILLLEPRIMGNNYSEKLNIAKAYVNDLLDFEGVKKVQLPMKGYEKALLPTFKLDLSKHEHLSGLPVKMYGDIIKKILIKNYLKAKQASN